MGNNVSIENMVDSSELSYSKSKDFIEEIGKKDPGFLDSQKDNKYIFFWLSKDNPDTVDKDKPKQFLWTPYDREDCLFLEYWYQRFLKGEKSFPSIENISLILNNGYSFIINRQKNNVQSKEVCKTVSKISIVKTDLIHLLRIPIKFILTW
jgi:hypothetical protein